MSDFHNKSFVKGRKPHRCEQCGKAIPIGEVHAKVAGSWGGDFYDHRIHAECETAAIAYATLHGFWGEEFPWFQHNDSEYGDWLWMVEGHPIVAKRLGWDEKLAEWQRDMAPDSASVTPPTPGAA